MFPPRLYSLDISTLNIKMKLHIINELQYDKLHIINELEYDKLHIINELEYDKLHIIHELLQ